MTSAPDLDPSMLLARWREELKVAMDAQREVNVKIWGLRKMIEGLEMVHPTLKPVPPTGDIHDGDGQDGPAPQKVVVASSKSVADHVRDILRENPGRWFASGDMVKAVRSRDAAAEPPAVRLALRRTEGTLTEKRGEGKGQTFRLKSESENDDLLGGLES